ncbi:hypothetical protein DPMN_161887, partial [Dreissena polymorpha]
SNVVMAGSNFCRRSSVISQPSDGRCSISSGGLLSCNWAALAQNCVSSFSLMWRHLPLDNNHSVNYINDNHAANYTNGNGVSVKAEGVDVQI